MTIYIWMSAVAGDWSDTSLWSPPGGPPDNGRDALITAAGRYTVTLAFGETDSLGSLSLSADGAELELDGTLNFVAARALGISAGTLALVGTIAGATIDSTGGVVSFDGGTLDGVTWQGTLDLSAAGAAVAIADGITLQDASGNLPGAVNLTGPGSTLTVTTSTILDNASITIGGGAELDFDAPGGTLTLGANLTIDSGIEGGGSLFDGSGSGGGVINDGAIDETDPSSPLQVAGDAFTNAGLITVDGGGFDDEADHFSNTGSILVEDGGTLTLDGAWTNTGTITISGGTLDLGGDVTTAQLLAELADINLSNATVNILGTIDNTGSTLNVGPGSAFGDLGVTLGLTDGGDIVGGTIADAGGGLTFARSQSGTLDGVTYQGTLDLSQSAYDILTIADGITWDASGTLPGQLNLGYDESVDITTSTTLDNATIDFGANAESSSITLAASGGTLTLGANLNVLVQTYYGVNSLDDQSGTTGDGIVNDGTIFIQSYYDDDGYSATLVAEGNGFANQGVITIGAFGTFADEAASFSNTGSISATDQGTLTLTGAWSNSGEVTITDSTLNLGGSFTTAQLAADDDNGVTLSDAQMNIIGTLDNNGATLTVGAGSALGDLGVTLGLAEGGDIIGGTIVDGGDGLIVPYGQSGTLDGVTYQGTLDLGQTEYGSLIVADGITLRDVTGTLPGTVLLTGDNDQLDVTTSTTLDTATLDIGDYSTIYFVAVDFEEVGRALTLGPDLTLQTAGAGTGTLNDASAGDGSDGIINDGTIHSNIAGDTLNVAGGAFTNTGLITVDGGGFDEDVSSFTNSGTINVADSGVLTLNGAWTNSGVITVTDATLALSGNVTTAQLLAELATVTLSGATIELTGTLDNRGTTLDVGPGTFLGTLLLAPGSDIVGGTIADVGDGLAFNDNDDAYYGNSATLDGVTDQGTLDLSPGTSWTVTITDGITLQGAGGSGPGAINLTGDSDRLLVNAGTLSGVTLDHATIDIGNDSALAFQDDGAALTLGPNLTLQQTGSLSATLADLADANPASGILNEGTIDANVTGDSFSVTGNTAYIGSEDPSSFTNQGVITVDNGDGFYIDTNSFSNTGTINVSDGSTLTLTGDWSNSGDINVTDSTLDLYGTFTTASLEAFELSDVTVNLDGTLDNAGATLNVGPGDSITALSLHSGGDLVGGVVTGATPGLVFAGGALDGVTYLGTLDLSNGDASVAISDGITLEDASGNLPGDIDLTGYDSSLYAVTGETLDNATIDIGSYDFMYLDGAGGTLTLGPNLTLHQIVSGSAYLYDNSLEVNYGSGGIVNDGTIDADVAGGSFFVSTYYNGDGSGFTNSGLIAIDNGDSFVITTEFFVNTGTVNVTNGSTLTLGSTLTFSGNWTNTGEIIVTDSTLDLGSTFVTATLIADLATGVTLSDATVNLIGTLDNTGATLDVGAGAVLGTLGLAEGGDIIGGSIVDSGDGLAFQGGTLDGVTYQGLMDLSAEDASVTITDGITLADSSGTLPGAIDLTGYDSALSVVTGMTLDTATVDIGNDSAVYFYGSGGTLTLGPDLTLQQVGSGYADLIDASDEYDYAGGGIVSDGTIDANATDGTFFVTAYYYYDSSFSNAGLITIDNGDSFVDETTYFSNTGTINVLDGSTLTLENDWSNSGAVTVTDSTLVLDGNFTTASLATFTLTGSTTEIDGILGNSGATLDVGPGTALGSVVLASGGDIIGGTIADSGDGIAFSGGTLDGVTYQGLMDLNGNDASVAIADGITLEDSSANLPGRVDLTGYDSQLDAVTGATLDNATITIGNDSSLVFSGYGGTLTLGAGLTLQQVGSGDAELRDLSQEYDDGGAGIVSDGTIEANVAGDTFFVRGYSYGDYGSAFTNNGLITVDNGEDFVDGAASFSNAGTIDVLDGSTLALQGGWSNSGDITVTHSTLDLTGDISTATLLAINVSAATVNFSGTLDNTGATLDVGAGSPIASFTLANGSDFLGGTIAESGGGFDCFGGTLDGVTYQGTMDLSGTDAAVSIADGIALQGAGGSGAGAINLTGDAGHLDVTTTTTLDNATIDLGDDSVVQLTAPAGTLTLGANLTLQQAGEGDGVVYDGSGGGGGGIINNGTIIANLAGQSFYVEGPSFTNNGGISVQNGDRLFIESPTFTNLAGGTLTAGSYDVGQGATLEMDFGGPITTLAASVTLNGAGSELTAGFIPLDSTLSTIAAEGTLSLLTSRSFITTNLLTVDGLLLLLAGTLSTGGTLAIGAGGTLFGHGVVTSPIANSGTVTAYGGLLTLSEGVSGSGALKVAANGKLMLQASSSAGTILDSGTLQLGFGSYSAAAETVAAGGRIVGLGTITNSVMDDGTIESRGGLLILAGGASGPGTLLVDAGSTLDLAVGTTVGTILDRGTLKLDGGTYAASTMVAAGGRVVGLGTIANAVALAGTLEAKGGLLILAGGASGSGTLLVDASSKLEYRANTSVGHITDNGTLQLTGYQLSVNTTATVSATGKLAGVGWVTNIVANSGTIEASGPGALTLAAGATGAGSLLVDTGSELDLRGATAAKTLTDNGVMKLFGTNAAITAATVSASGTAEGFGAFLDPLTDNGTVQARSGLLKLGAVGGRGGLQIANAATLELGGATSLDATFAAGAVGSLALDSQARFSGLIGGLGLGDTLQFKNEIVTSAVINAGATLAVTGSAGSTSYLVAGTLAGNHFAISPDGHALTLV